MTGMLLILLFSIAGLLPVHPGTLPNSDGPHSVSPADTTETEPPDPPGEEIPGESEPQEAETGPEETGPEEAEVTDSPAPGDTLQPGVDPPDRDIPELDDDPMMGPEADPEEPLDLEPVEPFVGATPEFYRKVTSDSLSRWQLWSDHGEWLSRQPGVISSQLGGLGRNDGFIIRGHENRHQRIYREGIPLNERIFGSANRKRLPHYSRMESVHESSSQIRYRSDYSTLRYHVTRPLTFINYEQTAYDYRSTEGFLTQNIRPGTNLSLAYWGKNEDEGYQNSSMGGRNAAVTMYHYLSDEWMLEGGFHYSGLQLGESHGYQITDMQTFSFDRFQAFAYQNQAQSSMRNSLFRITAFHRSDPESEATTRLTAYHDRYRRSHYDNSDSSFVRTLSSGITGRHIRKIGPMEIIGELESEWSVIDRDRFDTMDEHSWADTRGKGMVVLPLPARSRVFTWFQSGWRTDNFFDHEIGSRLELRFIPNLKLYSSYARGEQMPRPGHLYWQRAPVYGNPDLQNEIIQRAEVGVRYRSGSWDLGGEIHASLFDRPVLVGVDSTFVQAGSYTSAGATGWMGYDGDRFEFMLSGTVQQYFSDDARLENQLLDLSGQRVWTRASAYYKNYVYNSAAFMKIGFYIQASPLAYRASRYYPSMDYWDSNSWHPAPEQVEAQPIPEFVRLDLDLTARVRSAIFLFRLENALDNWLLPGYFETAYQPMPARRFRFGIRWVLRN